MNAIDAIGGTRRQRKLAEEVARFCVETMMPRMRTLDVIIELKMKLEDQVKGYCLSIDKRNFYIEIDKSVDTFEEFVKTVCHEMVHVKQGARNELVEKSAEIGPFRLNKQYWKGDDCSAMEYAKQPWEIEAYELQEELHDMFVVWKKNQLLNSFESDSFPSS